MSTDDGTRAERAERAERESIMFGLSPGFKDAIAKFAHENGDIPTAQLIREAVAEYIGYNLEQDRVKRGRPVKYKNKAEKKIASRRRSMERRALIKALEEHARKAEREKQAEALRASLVRKGIDPEA